jgi:hypothetical protein
MEPTADNSATHPGGVLGEPASVVSRGNSGSAALAPQQSAPAPCPTCGDTAGYQPRSYVYALGKIEPRFPSPAVEKEFAQAIGRSDTAGLTDKQARHAVLSKREHRYLTRQLCWVLTVQGLETYLLHPRDPMDLDLLAEAAEETDPTSWMSLVIGVRGPIAPPELCNGLMLPVVAFDQIYSFDRQSLIGAIPKPDDADADEFNAAAGELFDRLMLMTDNAGATDEHRALNYLAVRYPAIYAKAAEQFAANASLSAVEVRPSSLAGSRKIVDVILSFTDRTTDVADKFFTRVDVTEAFPFLVTKLSPYFDRY